MVRIKYLVNGKDVGRGVYLTCLDHNETRSCKNKTEALYQMRQPWVWCDGCAQIHFDTEWHNQLHHGLRTKTMTDKNVNTEIRKEFCPNCEAEVPCTHEAELYVCDICGEDFAKYIVSRNCALPDVSMTQDVLTDIKTGQSIENTNPDYYKQEIARLNAELLELNDKAVFIEFENEDELPAEIKDDVYSAMFECSHVDGVRLFPYIEENGQKYFLVMIDDFVGDSDHEHDDRIL